VKKGLGTVMKRTHLKISTVPKGVTYSLIAEQRTLTPVVRFAFLMIALPFA